MENSQIWCNNVVVRADAHGGMGAFAARALKRDQLIERGLVRLVDCDGHANPYVFIWTDDPMKPRWAIGSGCATFYNTSLDPNAHMIRNFDDLSFTIVAKRDIEVGEELTHLYRSLQWRRAFVALGKKLRSNETPVSTH